MNLVCSFKRYLSEAISWVQEKDRYMRVFTGMTGGMGQKEGNLMAATCMVAAVFFVAGVFEGAAVTGGLVF